MVVSVTVAAILGVAGAWAGSVLQSGGRVARTFAIALAGCLLFAVALPLVLHAAAWESTAGKFGWMILTQSGSRAEGTGGYGFFGGLVAAGWIHAVYGAAIVTLTTWHGVRTTPVLIVQQSRLDLGPMASWWRVRLPLAMPWLLLGLLLTGLLAASEMTVVDLYRFRTLADEFYLFYAADPTLVSVVITCAVPLALSMVVVTSLLHSRRGSITTQNRQGDAASNVENFSPIHTRIAGTIAVVLAAVIVGVPLIGMLIKLGHEVTVIGGEIQASWSAEQSIRRLFSAPMDFAAEYRWTGLIALLGGTLSVVIAAPMAMVGRTRPRWEPWIDAMAVIAFVIPGPIVGLVIVGLFQVDLPGFSMLYQQTLVPTLLALMMRAVPAAYWVLRSASRGIADSVIDASQLDTWPVRRWWLVHRPLLSRSYLAAGVVGGVIAAGDVPATLPVIPPGVTTVGTRLFGLLHSGARYQEAALALWYVFAVVVISSYFLRQIFAPRGKLE